MNPAQQPRKGPIMTERTYMKPGWFMRNVLNPVVVKLGQASELTVNGRTSGTPHTVAISPITVDGDLILLAPRGETDWVRNLRAVGEGELKHKGETIRFESEEITGDDRARMVGEYQRQLGKMVEPYFRKLPDPADHPSFRVIRQSQSANR